jgi:hypothetical protein
VEVEFVTADQITVDSSLKAGKKMFEQRKKSIHVYFNSCCHLWSKVTVKEPKKFVLKTGHIQNPEIIQLPVRNSTSGLTVQYSY